MKVIFASFLFLFLITQIFSQGDEPQTPLHYHTPPAPNAAAMARHGDIPVSYYTGTPNISIPIYSVRQGSLEVPISLSYHASGIKVDDAASWVGLGWSLNVGGSISRTIRGMADESSAGFLNKAHLISNPPDNSYYGFVSRNEIDAQSDIYFYSYPNGGGKFAFDSLGNKLIQNLTLESIKDPFKENTNERWILSDTKGVIYHFYEKDWSRVESADQPIYQDPSAWHIEKIISNDRADTILFFYQSETFSYDLKNQEGLKRIDYNNPRLGLICSSSDRCPQTIVPQVSESILHLTQKLPLRIVSGNQIVEFEMEARTDIIGSNRLKEIRILKRDGVLETLVKKFVFTHSYFGSINNKRLKLTSIQEFITNGQSLPPYNFEYNEMFELPRLGSSQQDHWGYFNKNTAGGIPEIAYLNSGYTFIKSGTNGDRDADSLKSLTYIIDKINYPTGGYSKFEFECHDIGHIGKLEALKLREELYSITSYGADIPPSEMYTIGDTIRVDTSFSAHISMNVSSQPAQGEYPHAGARLIKIAPFPEDIYSISTGNLGSDSFEADFILDAGATYVFEVEAEKLFDKRGLASIDLTVYRGIPLETSRDYIVGGARIKSIEEFDGLSITKKRIFSYVDDNGRSTGVLVRRPVYFYSSVDVFMSSCTPPSSFACSYHSFSSNSRVTLGEGAPIGYSLVTEIVGNSGENGFTKHYYTTAKDYQDLGGNYFPFSPSDDNSHKRGKEILTENFDAEGKLIQLRKNVYSAPSKKITNLNQVVSSSLKSFSQIVPYSFSTYSNQQEWSYLSSSRNVQYEQNDSIVTTTNYYYDREENHLFPTRIEKEQGGIKLITYMKYPQDYDSAADMHHQSMINKNMVEIPIEQQEWIEVDGVKTMRSGTIYDRNADGKPGDIYLYEGKGDSILSNEGMTGDLFQALLSDDDYVKRYHFEYNWDRNPIKQQKVGDVVTALIWDESIDRVMAEVTGASVDQIAYTSFESDEKGGWDFSGSPQSTGYIGDHHYQGTVSKSNLPAGTYTVSLWARSVGAGNTLSIDGDSHTIGSDWQWQEWQVEHTGGTLTLSTGGDVKIDEVRLHPVNAIMKTFLFDPVFGMTDQVDANGRHLNYVYDSFGRLEYVRDHNGHILQKVQYNYKEDE